MHPMFIAAVFTIAKIWKYIYYAAIKNEILPVVNTWLDLEGIMLSEVKSGRER